MFYEIDMLTQDRPRMPQHRVHENGLLTCDNEFSSGVFGGVSTCGDSDGLRAACTRGATRRGALQLQVSSSRRALRREGRGKDRFAGVAWFSLRFGLMTRPAHDRRETGSENSHLSEPTKARL